MANIEINKEGLFSIVKRITKENSPFSHKFSQINQKILLPNYITKRKNYSPDIDSNNNSPKHPNKKVLIFRNNFLEKNNIQINKQNVLNLITERRKLKLSEAKTFKNNNSSNNSIYPNDLRKIIKGKTVFINLEENDNNKNNKNKGGKVIKNSNSENFEKSLNKNITKNLLLLKSPKLNMDNLIKNSKSFFKMFNRDNDKINTEEKNNNINNNININININGDINNNKEIKNIINPNKRYISYYQKKGNNTEMNIGQINNNKYEENILMQNKDYFTEKNLNLKSNIIKKKHHRMFYLNNINKFEEENSEEKNKKEKTDFEHNNTVNINLNFISNPKDNYISKRISTNANKNKLSLNNNFTYNEEKENLINLRNSTNINRIKSLNLRNIFPNPQKRINKKENSYKKKEYRNENKIKPSKTLIFNNSNPDNIEKIVNNKIDIIQLEDLLILEGKFCHLMDCLKYDNPLPKMCAEWWNFYTYSSYFGKFPKLFPKKIIRNDINKITDYQIAHETILYELLRIILIYEILTENELRNRLINNLMELINEIHQNFLIECDFILSKVSDKSLSNLWIKKLKNIIISKKTWIKNNRHLSLLNQRNNNIHDMIQYLIKICANIINTNKNTKIDIDLGTLSYFNNNISNLRLTELNEYFIYSISKENKKISKAFSSIIKVNYNYLNQKNANNLILIPYLPSNIIGDKKYTLVLDLDETLISFRIGKNGSGIIKMRPGLFNFLKKVKTKYELVVFTAGTKEYAEPIIDIIEKKEKFFVKRLYRQHTFYKDNIYIKDLIKLGRDLSKIIIVDNMPQNFCLQKENGILISNYFGQDNGDNTLYLLADILLKIAQKPGRDVRTEIKKYKEEIFTKITTNLEN